MSGRGRLWGVDEIERMRSLSSGPMVDAAKALGRDLSSVYMKAKELGVAFPQTRPPRWTQWEINELWRLAGERTARQLGRKFKRSAASVKHKAARLGIRLNAGETLLDVARFLDVDEATVRRHRDLLGQGWRHTHKPRAPEPEEVQAIARSIVEQERGWVHTSLRRLSRIAQGVAADEIE